MGLEERGPAEKEREPGGGRAGRMWRRTQEDECSREVAQYFQDGDIKQKKEEDDVVNCPKLVNKQPALVAVEPT